VIRGIRRRQTFAALRSDAVKVRRRGLVVRYLPADTDVIEVAFAISSRDANAVRRNRCRRRLRAALVHLDEAGQIRPGAYLIAVSRGVIDAPQSQLHADLADAVHSFPQARP
jgi:ribonuclease P protein component